MNMLTGSHEGCLHTDMIGCRILPEPGKGAEVKQKKAPSQKLKLFEPKLIIRKQKSTALSPFLKAHCN